MGLSVCPLVSKPVSFLSFPPQPPGGLACLCHHIHFFFFKVSIISTPPSAWNILFSQGHCLVNYPDVSTVSLKVFICTVLGIELNTGLCAYQTVALSLNYF